MSFSLFKKKPVEKEEDKTNPAVSTALQDKDTTLTEEDVLKHIRNKIRNADPNATREKTFNAHLINKNETPNIVPINKNNEFIANNNSQGISGTFKNLSNYSKDKNYDDDIYEEKSYLENKKENTVNYGLVSEKDTEQTDNEDFDKDEDEYLEEDDEYYDDTSKMMNDDSQGSEEALPEKDTEQTDNEDFDKDEDEYLEEDDEYYDDTSKMMSDDSQGSEEALPEKDTEQTDNEDFDKDEDEYLEEDNEYYDDAENDDTSKMMSDSSIPPKQVSQSIVNQKDNTMQVTPKEFVSKYDNSKDEIDRIISSNINIAKTKIKDINSINDDYKIREVDTKSKTSQDISSYMVNNMNNPINKANQQTSRSAQQINNVATYNNATNPVYNTQQVDATSNYPASTQSSNSKTTNINGLIDAEVRKKTQNYIAELLATATTMKKNEKTYDAVQDVSLVSIITPMINDYVKKWLDNNIESLVYDVVRSEIRRLLPDDYK